MTTGGAPATPSVLGFLARHGRSALGPTIVLAVLALLAAFVAAAAPRIIAGVVAAELQSDVGAMAEVNQDMTTGPGVHYLGDETIKGLETIQETAVEPLASRMGTMDWFARSPVTQPVIAEDAAKNNIRYQIQFAGDPAFDSRVHYTAGHAPGPGSGDFGTSAQEIALSTESAKEMGWAIGEERLVGQPSTIVGNDTLDQTVVDQMIARAKDTTSPVGPNQQLSRVVLVGTFDAIDPAADYWAHATNVLDINVINDGNGNAPRTLKAIAMEAGAVGDVTAWWPLDLTGLDPAKASELLPPLRKFLAARPTVPGFDTTSPQTVHFSTGTVSTIQTALGRGDALRSILAVVGVGPFGAMIAVFELTVRTIVGRRRPTIALASARGASPGQIRSALALEGAAGGLVPVILGIVVAMLVIPGDFAPLDLLPAALLGLAPVAFLAGAPLASGLREARADGAGRRSAAVRIVVEVAICLLAAASITMLVLRGLGRGSTSDDTAVSAGLDPFLLVAPILLALAVCVLVLRLLPPVLRAVHAGTRTSRGLIGFTGSARAVRERGLGVGATLAVVIAVGVTVFAVILGATVSGATRSAARLAAGGGDGFMLATWFSPDQISAVEAIPGVTRAAGVEDLGATAFDGWHGGRIDLVATDWAALAAVRGDLPADTASGSAIPAVVSAKTAAALAESGATLSISGKPIEVIGTLPEDPGLHLPSVDWVLMDAARVPWSSGLSYAPSVLVVSVEPGAVITAAELERASGAPLAVSASESLAAISRSPAIASIGTLLTSAALLAALLALIAIVLAGQLSASASRRIYGALRTLGATRSQIAGLAMWSVAPSVAAALVAGVGLGIALPYVVVAGVDLTPFTGGSTVAGPSGSPWTVAAIALVLLIDAAAIALLAAAFTVRRSPAATVSIGGD